MRRFSIFAVLLLFVLTACGGSSAAPEVPTPPSSAVLENSSNAQIAAYIESLKTSVPASMTAHSVQNTNEKPITQEVYQSTASLEDLATFYKTLEGEDWTHSRNMPLLDGGVLIDGYEKGNWILVIHAVEAQLLGGESGVIVYTAKGTK
jgi:hypothetical protein